MTQAASDLPQPNLPPISHVPKALQGTAFLFSRRWTVAQLARHYGKVFTLDLPVAGPSVIVADARLAKHVFTARSDLLGNFQPNMSRVLGPGSVFALDGDDHLRRRRLLTPAFHGKSMNTYAHIIEEETLREIAGWPNGRSFPALPSMMRITLNAILRAVFGADGEQLQELGRLLPRYITLGSRLAPLPAPNQTYGRYTPWGQLLKLRRKYDAIVDKLIDAKCADPNFEQQTDVLAMMLRNTDDDGSTMSRNDIRDELLTLLGAGHETTSATLGWAFERTSRHPDVLEALSAEADTDENAYRQAAILEVQRTRTVVDLAGRHVYAPTFDLGGWVIPRGYSIFISISQIHADAELFPDPDRFDPQRFTVAKPSSFAWIPFGGGTRRCVGAAFANLEIDIVLRTVLRHFTIEPSAVAGEKWHSRGSAYTPKSGGKIVVHRRQRLSA